MDTFEGKVALVTGASSGIGEALAVALSQAGAIVVLTARDEDRLEAAKKKCDGRPVWSFPADVTSEAQVQKMKSRMEGWVLSLARTGR